MAPVIATLRYKSTRNDDGSYNIHSVPILGRINKGDKDAPKTIGAAWMRKAIEAAAVRLKDDGYTPPIHIEHHGAETTARAGEFRLTEVRTLKYDGAEQPVLFADLVNLSKETFDAIMAGDLPYRSVEIHDLEKPAVNTLALLDDDEPFFKFPNLNAAVVDQSFSATRRGLAFAGNECRVLFAFKETPAVEHNYTLVHTAGSGTKPASWGLQDSGGSAVPGTLTVPPGVIFKDDDGDDDTVEKIEAKIKALTAKLKKLKAQSEPDDKKPDDGKPDAKPAEPMKGIASPAEVKKLAALEGRLSAAEDKLNARESADAIDARVSGAFAALKGWHISDTTKDRIRKMAALEGDAAQLAVDTLVETYKAGVPKEPMTLAAIGAVSTDTPEVTAYQAKGPEAFEQAQAKAAEFAGFDGMTRLTLKQYLAAECGELTEEAV